MQVVSENLFNYQQRFLLTQIFEIHLPRAIPTKNFTAVFDVLCNELLQVAGAARLLAAKGRL